MKKKIFIIIFNLACGCYLFANDESQAIYIKRSILSGVNYFLPEFLRIDKEKSFINTSITYDSLASKKLDYHISLRLKLPELIITKTKKSHTPKTKTTNKTHYNTKIKEFKFKLRPYIRVRKSKLTAFLGAFATYEIKDYFNYSISNSFYYYPFDNNWSESISFSISKGKYSTSLSFSTDKTTYDTISYTYGVYRQIVNNSKMNINTGYEISGNTDSNPVCYSHKLFVKYRHTLFNSKRAFIDITPYLLYSKSYDYELKPALSASINYKF